jgi:hypothetical protein
VPDCAPRLYGLPNNNFARQTRFVYRRVRNDAIAFVGFASSNRIMRNFVIPFVHEEVSIEMFNRSLAAAITMMLTISASSDAAQQITKPQISAVYRYADIADLALASSVTAHVKIKSAKKVPARLSAGVRPGATRYLVVADVIALLRAHEPLPPRIQYIIDLSPDSLGRTPQISKTEAFVFAHQDRPGAIRLVAPDAQIPWSPEAASVIRSILTEANGPAAPPKVIGVASAFHTAGALPGEGETQIFLESEDARPISLTVIRAPGAASRWYVSLGEVVDQAAAMPKRNTVLWYRLACSLPATIPAITYESLNAEAAKNVQDDYLLIMAGLGTCPRTRPRTAGL